MALATRQVDYSSYGQCWGEGAARCFSIEGDFLDDAQGLRLMPVPDSFFCPISAALMNDPVATVDGCAYEREYIERWFRERRQYRQPITSPTTGLELQSTTLMPLRALQCAIEAYLLHRPELRRDHLSGRSFEEAAQVLQIDLLEKQASNADVVNELYRLREANKALKRALRETEESCLKVMQELDDTKVRLFELEDEKSGTKRRDAPKVRSALRPSLPALAPQSVPKLEKVEGRGVKWAPPAPGPKAQNETAKLESQRRKVGEAEAEVSKLQSREIGACTQQFLQGALLAALLALCLFLQLRNPAGVKAPLSTLPGRAVWEQKIAAGLGNFTISRHVEQLQSGGADERIIAATMLQKIVAEGDASQAAFLEAGATEPLAKLLEDSEERVQEAGALALATLVSSSGAGQAAVAKAGAISPLVQLLKSADVDVVPKAAASVLRHLAAGSEQNQVAIARAGAITPLVEIMRSNVPDARFEAASALRELAGEGLEGSRYGKQVTIAQAGAIVPLVKLIRDENPGARQAAAGVLRRLATNNADNQVAIAQAGAIGPLVDLLGDAEPGSRQEAAAALDHLSVVELDTNFGNQAAIGQAGAIAELAKLLQDDVPEVAFAAVGALRSLAAGNADNLERVVQAGSIPALVLLFKHHKAADKVAVSAISLLRSLAASSAGTKAAIIESGVSSELLKG